MDAIRHVSWVPKYINYAYAAGTPPETQLESLQRSPRPSWPCRILCRLYHGGATNYQFYHAVLTYEHVGLHVTFGLNDRHINIPYPSWSAKDSGLSPSY